MAKVNMHDAKTNLSRLVDRALEGEEVIVARSGKPLVRLVPVDAKVSQRPVGLHAAPLGDDEAREAMRPLTNEEWGLSPNAAFEK
jgi:prevent-host-death family protein